MSGRRVVLRHQLENPIRDKVCDAVRKLYGIRSIQMNLKFDAGWPDRWFLIAGGKPFLIEFKAPGKPLAELQKYRVEELRTLGYDVEVHDDYDTAMAAIKLRFIRKV